MPALKGSCFDASPAPTVAVEQREGYLSCGGTRGLCPTPGLLSPDFECQEEVYPQNQAMKIRGIPTIQVRQIAAGTKSLKGPAHRFTHKHALTLGSSREKVVLEVPETYREKLSCVASGQGLKEQLSLFLC